MQILHMGKMQLQTDACVSTSLRNINIRCEKATKTCNTDNTVIYNVVNSLVGTKAQSVEVDGKLKMYM